LAAIFPTSIDRSTRWW